MFNVVIYWVSLGSNGIFYSLNGIESKVFVLISKVAKLKLEEFSGMPPIATVCICIYVCICVRVLIRSYGTPNVAGMWDNLTLGPFTLNGSSTIGCWQH